MSQAKQATKKLWRRDPALLMMLANLLLVSLIWLCTFRFSPWGLLAGLQISNIGLLFYSRRNNPPAPPVSEDQAKIDAIRAAGAC